MHIADRWSEDIDSGRLDELLRFLGCSQGPGLALNRVVNLRAGSYIANLSLYKDCGVNCLNCFDRFFRAGDILFEWQSGKIDDDRIKAGFRCLDCLKKRVCVVRVEKDECVGIFTQTVHDSSKLARSKEISLSFRGAHKYGNPDFNRGCENRFQENEVRDIEVAKGRSFFFEPCQNIS